MKVAIYKYTLEGTESSSVTSDFEDKKANLVIAFASKELMSKKDLMLELQKQFPNAEVVLASTSGEIFETEVDDDTMVASAIMFEDTPIKTISLNRKDFKDDEALGKALSDQLKAEDLRYMMLISDGGMINASLLLQGMSEIRNTLITGGLAGDAANFKETWVGLNQTPKAGELVGIGFYGDKIQVSSGQQGGWEEFGLSRTITKSVYNELLEVDGENILDLYKTYLGNYAQELPSSALLFPISLQFPNSDEKVVRTILSIDEGKKSLYFAGDMPEGSTVRLMKSTADHLIDAAGNATKIAMKEMDGESPKLAFLVSCVGRKLVLRSRVDEEVEEIKKNLPEETSIFGYYSYGEISPNEKGARSKLHNQTLTITLMNEKLS